ncbi:unnamed protein product [Symbiodinium necroappetens]|nr:unnamed protein product [Symbiodinium necroappetens]
MLACNKAGKWDLSLSLLRDACDEGKSEDWLPEETVSVVGAGLGACAESGAWQQALLLLEKVNQAVAEPANAKALSPWVREARSTAMLAAIRAAAWEPCLALLDLQGAPSEQLAALGCAVRACGLGRNWQGALELSAKAKARALKEEWGNIWSAQSWACQASDAPQPVAAGFRILSLPM